MCRNSCVSKRVVIPVFLAVLSFPCYLACRRSCVPERVVIPVAGQAGVVPRLIHAVLPLNPSAKAVKAEYLIEQLVTLNLKINQLTASS